MRASRSIISVASATAAGLAALLMLHRADQPVRTIQVGQNPGVIAVDARTGRAFVLDNGSLGFNTSGGIAEGSIHTLDTRSGRVLITVPAGTAPDDVAVDEQTGRVFVLNSYMHNGGQGTVSVLDARSGQIVQTTQVGDIPSALALDTRADRLFVLNVANGIHAQHAHYAQVSVLDAASGRLIGGFNPIAGADLSGYGGMAVDGPRHRIWLAVSSPRGSAALEVFDTRTNAIAGRIPLGTTTGATIALSSATGRAFVFAPGRMLVLDAARMRVIRVIPSPSYSQPLVDERTGRIFMAEQAWNATQNAPNWGRTETGSLRILDARTGNAVATLPIEWPDGMAIDEQSGQIMISHAGAKRDDGAFVGHGHVDVRDGFTGRLLWTIPVGVGPAAMTVDARTRQALVVNEGGQVPAVDRWGWLPAAVRQCLSFIPPPPGPTRNVSSSVSLIPLGPAARAGP